MGLYIEQPASEFHVVLLLSNIRESSFLVPFNRQSGLILLSGPLSFPGF